MKRFLSKIVLWGFLVFVGLNLVAFVSLYFLSKSYLYKPQFLENGIKENKFDYLVLGSSTGLTSLNTKLIDSITGYNGLNMSMDDTSMSAHYLMLAHFYALGKTSGKVILTITPWDAIDSKPTLGNNDCRFITHLDKAFVYDYYKAMETGLIKPLTYSRFFPLFGMSYYNAEVFYPSLMTVFKPTKRNRFDDKGNYTYRNNGIRLTEREITTSEISIRNPYFKKIQKLCNDNNSKLVVYIAPLYQRRIILSDDFGYLVNHSNLLSDSSLFYDDIHVNSLGREKTTIQFAKTMAIFLNDGEK